MSKSSLQEQSSNLVELPGNRSGLPREAWEWLHEQGKGRKPAATYEELTFGQKKKCDAWRLFVERWRQHFEQGEFPSERAAFESLAKRIRTGRERPNLIDAAALLGRGKATMPSYQNAARKLSGYKERGVGGLWDKHTGQQTGWRDWWVPCMREWLTPQRPLRATVAKRLRRAGFDVTDKQVLHFLHKDRLPAHLGDNCKWRAGKNYHQQNFTPYVIRDYSNLPVGHTWEADGHTCDFYVLHPVSGKPFRPELTVWVDEKSDRILNFRLWDRESALNTLFSLGNAIYNNNHVPSCIHVDRGPGFKNKLMDDEAITGYLAKLGITRSLAHARNARSKGRTEGLFKIFEEELGKEAPSFCGHGRTDGFMQRQMVMMEAGKVEVWSWDEAIARIESWVTERNNKPRKAAGERTPNQLWAEDRIPDPPEISEERLRYLSVERKVFKGRVRFDNNFFQHEKLGEAEGRMVIVEFDPLSYAAGVIINWQDGSFLCRAERVIEIAAAPASFLESTERKREASRIANRRRQIEEIEAQKIDTQDTTEITDRIYNLENQPDPLHDFNTQQVKRAAAAGERVKRGDADDDPEIDILDTNY